MRWPTKADPRVWDTRTRRVFAWWPTELTTGETAWLERVEVVETYWPGGYASLSGWEYTEARPYDEPPALAKGSGGI